MVAPVDISGLAGEKVTPPNPGAFDIMKIVDTAKEDPGRAADLFDASLSRYGTIFSTHDISKLAASGLVAEAEKLFASTFQYADGVHCILDVRTLAKAGLMKEAGRLFETHILAKNRNAVTPLFVCSLAEVGMERQAIQLFDDMLPYCGGKFNPTCVAMMAEVGLKSEAIAYFNKTLPEDGGRFFPGHILRLAKAGLLVESKRLFEKTYQKAGLDEPTEALFREKIAKAASSSE